jgi:nucleoside-diphosphate-sugar epimerase
MAAEQIAKPQVHGQTFFSRDFDDNVVTMMLRAFAGTAIKPLVLPSALIYTLAWLMDIIERCLILLYALFGRKRVASPGTVDIKAMNMAYMDITVRDDKARKVLGYEPLVDKETCLEETARWCEEFYPTLLK